MKYTKQFLLGKESLEDGRALDPNNPSTVLNYKDVHRYLLEFYKRPVETLVWSYETAPHILKTYFELHKDDDMHTTLPYELVVTNSSENYDLLDWRDEYEIENFKVFVAFA